jgi:hypothetical protein
MTSFIEADAVYGDDSLTGNRTRKVTTGMRLKVKLGFVAEKNMYTVQESVQTAMYMLYTVNNREKAVMMLHRVDKRIK